ncbi:MAG: nucleoside transporter C-terminal domain-containing protein, partial [Bacteroidota bacterium]
LAWLLGIASSDVMLIGQLLGEKSIMNEFFAYTTLTQFKLSGVLEDPRSVIIATYALCGFANFASIGIQIGGIGALAPGRRALLSQLGLKALLGGTVASLLNAALAGMLV